MRGTVTVSITLETPDDEDDEVEDEKNKDLANLEEPSIIDPIKPDPFLHIDIQSSKYEVKSKDATRLLKLGQEYMFSKILESKSDLNFKIAKVITNAVGWELDFSEFRQGKQIFRVPARKYAGIVTV